VVNPVAIAIAGGAVVLAFAWPWNTVKQTVESTYPIAAHGTLSIENASGDIAVESWNGSTVKVVVRKEASSSDELGRIGVNATASGGDVTIKTVYPSHCTNCDVAYDIKVPRAAALVAEESSGDMKITDIGGPAHLQTASGDISVVRSGGLVIAQTESGTITVNGAGSFRGKTSSGDIKLQGTTGDVDARAASGNVWAQLANVGTLGAIKLETASGDVTLTIPRGSDATIEAQTQDGSIRSDFGQAPNAGYAGATLAQILGTGRVKIYLDAASGSIRLRAL
jgi:DUF4097 and DUF4098 domain-containing protein YvlB